MSLNGLLGGAMIGAAAGTLMIFGGEIMGASGIASSAILSPLKSLQDASQHWKLAFLGSFLTVSTMLAPSMDTSLLMDDINPTALGLAGLLVGAGTKLGNGCTSGHGICGLARFSKRSFAAVCAFMATAIATVVVLRPADHLPAISVSPLHTETSLWGPILSGLSLALHVIKPKAQRNLPKLVVGALAGGLFANGLFVSGMVYPKRLFGFLDVSAMASGNWDPTLAFVMGGGVIVSLLSYQFVRGHSSVPACERPTPVCDTKFGVPTNQTIDRNLIAGAVIFGLGWGTGGICPGPALFQAVRSDAILFFWWPMFAAGSHLASEYKKTC